MSLTTRVGKAPVVPRSLGGDVKLFVYRGTIARSDTTVKPLFKVGPGLVPVALFLNAAAGSNGGTSANVSVGKTGTSAHFINAADVKGAAGVGRKFPSASNLNVSVGAAEIQVVGKYAETGSPSTTGGAWSVTMICA